MFNSCIFKRFIVSSSEVENWLFVKPLIGKLTKGIHNTFFN
jgi:hypothetical protein